MFYPVPSVLSPWQLAVENKFHSFSCATAVFLAKLNPISPMSNDLKSRVVTFLSPYMEQREISCIDLLQVIQDINHVFQKLRCSLLGEVSKKDIELTKELLGVGASATSREFLNLMRIFPKDMKVEEQKKTLELLLKAGADANSISPEEFFEITLHFSPYRKRIFAESLILDGGTAHRTRWLKASIQNGEYSIAYWAWKHGAVIYKLDEEEHELAYYLVNRDQTRPLNCQAIEILKQCLKREQGNLCKLLDLALTSKCFEGIPPLLHYKFDYHKKEEEILSHFGEIVEAFFRSHGDQILELNEKCLWGFVQETKRSPEEFAALSFQEKAQYLWPIKENWILSMDNRDFFDFFYWEFFDFMLSAQKKGLIEHARGSIEKTSPEYRDVAHLVLKMFEGYYKQTKSGKDEWVDLNSSSQGAEEKIS